MIVGGGAVGLATAYLSAAKGFRVALVERGNVLSGATGFSAGIVTTQLSLEEDVRLALRTIEVLESVQRTSEVEFMEETGFVTIEPYWMVEESARVLSSQSVKYEVLDESEVRDAVPFLTIRDYERGLRTYRDKVVDSDQLGKAYSKLCRLLEIDVYSRSKIIEARKSGDSIEGIVLDREGLIRADSVVFAAGPWNKTLMSELGIYDVPTVIYRCQVVKVKTAAPNRYVPFYVAENHLYMRKDIGMTSIAGNGYSKVVERVEDAIGAVEIEYVHHIVDLLLKRVRTPEKFFVVGGWSGPCSSTSDGMPLIGRVPGTSNCFIVDGLDGYGLMRSAGVAELLLDSVTTGKEVEWASPSREMVFNGDEEVVELHSI